MLPGDRVDVLLTRKREDGRDNDDLITDVVLQSVRILAIDQLTDEQREKPQIARTATVEVTTYQAQKLALAMQVGTLSLALRNVVALEEDTTRRVRVADLVETKSQVARPKAPSVVVRRGAQTSVQNVGLP